MATAYVAKTKPKVELQVQWIRLQNFACQGTQGQGTPFQEHLVDLPSVCVAIGIRVYDHLGSYMLQETN